MSTNGVPLINKKKMEGIMPYAKWIRFSVNGGTKEDYSNVHACDEADFERLVQVLDNCAKYKKENKLDVQLIIQFIIYDLNWTSIQQIVDIHKKVGTDQLVFRKVIKDPGEDRVNFNPRIMDELKKIDGEKDVVIRWKTFEKQDDTLRWKKCYGINFRINMDHKGDLNTCNRNLFKNSKFGNIHEQSFIDIWNSEKRKKMFRAIEDQVGIPDCARFCQTSFDNMIIEQKLRNESLV
jgi:radical SAM protein with 4Fe4S-binding SPASM domain